MEVFLKFVFFPIVSLLGFLFDYVEYQSQLYPEERVFKLIVS